MLNQNGRLKEEAAPPTGSHSAQQTQQSTHTHTARCLAPLGCPCVERSVSRTGPRPCIAYNVSQSGPHICPHIVEMLSQSGPKLMVHDPASLGWQWHGRLFLRVHVRVCMRTTACTCACAQLHTQHCQAMQCLDKLIVGNTHNPSPSARPASASIGPAFPSTAIHRHFHLLLCSSIYMFRPPRLLGLQHFPA